MVLLVFGIVFFQNSGSLCLVKLNSFNKNSKPSVSKNPNLGRVSFGPHEGAAEVKVEAAVVVGAIHSGVDLAVDPAVDPALDSLIKGLKEKYPETHGSWKLMRSPSGKITTILGGVVPNAATDTDSASRLARDIAMFLGVPADQVSPTPFHQPQAQQKTYRFLQKIGDFEIADGWLSIHARAHDGTVFMVGNDLKKIATDELEILKAQIQGQNPYHSIISIDEAKSIVFELLSIRYSGNHNSGLRAEFDLAILGGRPQIWVEENATELAWLLLARIKYPLGQEFHSVRFLVGGKSKKILFERSTLSRVQM